METIDKKLFTTRDNNSINHEDGDFIALKSIMLELIDKHVAFVYKRIKEFERSIKKQFPNYIEYKMYYALVGSIVEPTFRCDKFDFPGRYSVRAFILNLWEECMKLEKQK